MTLTAHIAKLRHAKMLHRQAHDLPPICAILARQAALKHSVAETPDTVAYDVITEPHFSHKHDHRGHMAHNAWSHAG